MKRLVKGVFLAILLSGFTQVPQAIASAGLGGGTTQSTKELWDQAMDLWGGMIGVVGDTFGTPVPTIVNESPLGATAMAMSAPACACGSQNASLMDAMLVGLGDAITGIPITYVTPDQAKQMIDKGQLVMINTLQNQELWHYKGDILAHGGDFLDVLHNGTIPKDKYIYPYATWNCETYVVCMTAQGNGYKVAMVEGGAGTMLTSKHPVVINGTLCEVDNGQTKLTPYFEPWKVPGFIAQGPDTFKMGDVLSKYGQFMEVTQKLMKALDAEGKPGTAQKVNNLRNMVAGLVNAFSDKEASLTEKLLKTEDTLALAGGGGSPSDSVNNSNRSDLAGTLRATLQELQHMLLAITHTGRVPKSISPMHLRDAMKNDPRLASHIIDVRERSENILHIDGSRNVPKDSCIELLKTDKLGIPKDEPVIFLCTTGGRAGHCALEALLQGYKNVYNMLGGTMAITGSGVPLIYNGTPLPNPMYDIPTPTPRVLPMNYYGYVPY